MSANQIIVGFSFVALLLVGCGRSDSTAKKDDAGNGSAEHPIQNPSHTVAPPSKTSKVTFGNTENDPLQLNGNPFFIPTFDSSGQMSEGFDISDTILDASGIAKAPFPLMIGTGTSNDRTGYEVKLRMIPASNVFYISSDRTVVPAQSAVVPGDGPFITLIFLEGQRGSSPIINGTFNGQQGARKWSGNISTSGFLISDVEPLPIQCWVTNSANSQAFSYVFVPVFRGGQPGLITYTLYR